ncbi:MAG: uncharacterized protein KVP18_003184 [Porospora cf. gigantea A]|uniref:uncharacterized protein n=1 Tax=Porospora cf. gigantea A TaxID=2853593 RepID=UPI003559AC7A|nr:MAG: hypothetical protein KVP18_003184 [Porospora cf. gigantea A]
MEKTPHAAGIWGQVMDRLARTDAERQSELSGLQTGTVTAVQRLDELSRKYSTAESKRGALSLFQRLTNPSLPLFADIAAQGEVQVPPVFQRGLIPEKPTETVLQKSLAPSTPSVNPAHLYSKGVNSATLEQLHSSASVLHEQYATLGAQLDENARVKDTESLRDMGADANLVQLSNEQRKVVKEMQLLIAERRAGLEHITEMLHQGSRHVEQDAIRNVYEGDSDPKELNAKVELANGLLSQLGDVHARLEAVRSRPWVHALDMKADTDISREPVRPEEIHNLLRALGYTEHAVPVDSSLEVQRDSKYPGVYPKSDLVGSYGVSKLQLLDRCGLEHVKEAGPPRTVDRSAVDRQLLMRGVELDASTEVLPAPSPQSAAITPGPSPVALQPVAITPRQPVVIAPGPIPVTLPITPGSAGQTATLETSPAEQAPAVVPPSPRALAEKPRTRRDAVAQGRGELELVLPRNHSRTDPGLQQYDVDGRSLREIQQEIDALIARNRLGLEEYGLSVLRFATLCGRVDRPSIDLLETLTQALPYYPYWSHLLSFGIPACVGLQVAIVESKQKQAQTALLRCFTALLNNHDEAIRLTLLSAMNDVASPTAMVSTAFVDWGLASLEKQTVGNTHRLILSILARSRSGHRKGVQYTSFVNALLKGDLEIAVQALLGLEAFSHRAHQELQGGKIQSAMLTRSRSLTHSGDCLLPFELPAQPPAWVTQDGGDVIAVAECLQRFEPSRRLSGAGASAMAAQCRVSERQAVVVARRGLPLLVSAAGEHPDSVAVRTSLATVMETLGSVEQAKPFVATSECVALLVNMASSESDLVASRALGALSSLGRLLQDFVVDLKMPVLVPIVKTTFMQLSQQVTSPQDAGALAKIHLGLQSCCCFVTVTSTLQSSSAELFWKAGFVDCCFSTLEATLSERKTTETKLRAANRLLCATNRVPAEWADRLPTTLLPIVAQFSDKHVIVGCEALSVLSNAVVTDVNVARRVTARQAASIEETFWAHASSTSRDLEFLCQLTRFIGCLVKADKKLRLNLKMANQSLGMMERLAQNKDMTEEEKTLVRGFVAGEANRRVYVDPLVLSSS